MRSSHTPKILAPAGDKTTFLAALAAGADAIYCGLKLFSARMEATNFSIEELSRLSRLAKSRQVQVHIAFNTLIKESETDKALRLLAKLHRYVAFDVLIVQDPAVISLARQAGITQDLHLSTLGNLSFAAGLEPAHTAGFSQVVLPREFSLDDIRAMAEKPPMRCPWKCLFTGHCVTRFPAGATGVPGSAEKRTAGPVCPAMPADIPAQGGETPVFLLHGFFSGRAGQSTRGDPGSSHLENRRPEKKPPLCVLHGQGVSTAPGSSL